MPSSPIQHGSGGGGGARALLLRAHHSGAGADGHGTPAGARVRGRGVRHVPPGTRQAAAAGQECFSRCLPYCWRYVSF